MPLSATKPSYEADKLDPRSAADPQRRQRQPPPPNPNDRNSNYDVYDNYFDSNDNRNSGMGDVGLGFLNGSMDDSDDDEPQPKKAAENPFASKHDALAAATSRSGPGQGPRQKTPSPPPPTYIAAPQPGYVAPIASLNMAKPEPAAAPSGPGSQRRGNPGLQVATNRQAPPPPMSPASPHPLQGPASPITPAFARPRPPKNPGVSFEKSIMRGGEEGTTLPKRGEAGDDFWRRFSMVAKESRSKGPKQSLWLQKTESGKNKLATWVWVVGLVIALCVAGGIGIGWYVSHKAPDHQQPVTFGGSAGEAAPSSSMKNVGSGNPSIKSSLAVRPTHTVARRFVPRSEVTAAPVAEEHRRAVVNVHRRH